MNYSGFVSFTRKLVENLKKFIDINYQCCFRNHFDPLWPYQMHFSGFQLFFCTFLQKICRGNLNPVKSRFYHFWMPFFIPKNLIRKWVPFFQSEAFILISTNPQYDKRLFIDLPVQYMKTTKTEHVVRVHKLFWMSKQKTICVHNIFCACSFHVLNW